MLRRSIRSPAHASRLNAGVFSISARPGRTNVGSVFCMPGMLDSTHALGLRRRFCACGRMTRAAVPPNSTIRLRLQQRDQPMQEGLADRDLARRWRPPARGAPGQQRRQHQLRSGQADADKHLIQQLTFGSGEGMAAAVFLPARRFADDQRRRRGVALGEHKIAGGVAQGAPVEAGQGGAQRIQRCGADRLPPAPVRRVFPLAVRPRRPVSARAPGAGFASFGAQPVDGVVDDRLVGAPLNLQPQQCESVIQARRPGNDPVLCEEQGSSCRHASPDLPSPAAG